MSPKIVTIHSNDLAKGSFPADVPSLTFCPLWSFLSALNPKFARQSAVSRICTCAPALTACF